MGPRSGISNKFPSEEDAAGAGTTLGELLGIEKQEAWGPWVAGQRKVRFWEAS